MEENLYKVEKIRRKKYSQEKATWLYLVKWQGYDSEESTWEPEENLCYIPQVVEKFNKKWEAKMNLLKKNTEKKLDGLVTRKLRRNRPAEVHEVTHEIEMIEEKLEGMGIENTVNECEDHKNLFENFSISAGNIYSNEISRIIGLREFRGKLFVAVAFKSKGDCVYMPGVFEFAVVKQTFAEMLKRFLVDALKKNKEC